MPTLLLIMLLLMMIVFMITIAPAIGTMMIGAAGGGCADMGQAVEPAPEPDIQADIDDWIFRAEPLNSWNLGRLMNRTLNRTWGASCAATPLGLLRA
ncbi:MAG TPA: hypothetical protein VLX09_25385 [Stellaceae bacterium]|nr:hypothetical protein [Stellaceae bacterium]